MISICIQNKYSCADIRHWIMIIFHSFKWNKKMWKKPVEIITQLKDESESVIILCISSRTHSPQRWSCRWIRNLPTWHNLFSNMFMFTLRPLWSNGIWRHCDRLSHSVLHQRPRTQNSVVQWRIRRKKGKRAQGNRKDKWFSTCNNSCKTNSMKMNNPH